MNQVQSRGVYQFLKQNRQFLYKFILLKTQLQNFSFCDVMYVAVVSVLFEPNYLLKSRFREMSWLIV